MRREENPDSREIGRSGTRHPGGTVETPEEVEANPEGREILISNMRGNQWDRAVRNNNSYRVTQPLNNGDGVLDTECP